MASTRDNLPELLTAKEKKHLTSLLKKCLENSAKHIEQQFKTFNHLLKRKKLTGRQAEHMLVQFSSAHTLIQFCVRIANLIYALDIKIEKQVLLQLNQYRQTADEIEREIKKINAMLQDIHDHNFPDPDTSAKTRENTAARVGEIMLSPYASLRDREALTPKMATQLREVTERKRVILEVYHASLRELIMSGMLTGVTLKIVSFILSDQPSKDDLNRYKKAKEMAHAFSSLEEFNQFCRTFFTWREFVQNKALDNMAAIFALFDDVEGYTTEFSRARAEKKNDTDDEMEFLATVKAMEKIIPRGLACEDETIIGLKDALDAYAYIKEKQEDLSNKLKHPQSAGSSFVFVPPTSPRLFRPSANPNPAPQPSPEPRASSAPPSGFNLRPHRLLEHGRKRSQSVGSPIEAAATAFQQESAKLKRETRADDARSPRLFKPDTSPELKAKAAALADEARAVATKRKNSNPAS